MLQQTETFFMRISPQEKAMLADVAKHFQRTQADAIRALVRETYAIVKAEKQAERKARQQPAPA